MKEEIKVLVIEKETSIAHSIQKAVKLADGESIFASEKQDALEIARKEKPNLIILGYLAPRGESFRLHEELKENPETKNIPLLIVDVAPEEQPAKGWIKDEGMRMNAEDYVHQPISPRELAQRVEKLIPQKRTSVNSASPKENDAVKGLVAA